MKKPGLRLVKTSPANHDAPPATLGKAGATLWKAIMGEYEIADSGGREMLMQVCAASDRLADIVAAIDNDGPVIRSKPGMREHVLLKAELATRAFIVRTLARLGLDLEPLQSSAGRPAGKYGDE